MTYNINDPKFINSSIYQNFMEENPAMGNLKIRAQAARGAIPISNLKVIVSKQIDNNTVVFFEGYTDSSGMIEDIKLPVPKLNQNDLIKPNNTTYNITAFYEPDNITNTYLIYMYEDVCVMQVINITPKMNMGGL